MRKPKALILCIIDDDFGLDTRKELLQDNGYEVLTAQSRQKGMGLFVAHPIDAVVLDKRMNGDRVARLMKRIKPEIPILMVSACRLSTKELSYVDAFLCKGESWSALVSTVDRLLNSRFPFFGSLVGGLENSAEPGLTVPVSFRGKEAGSTKIRIHPDFPLFQEPFRDIAPVLVALTLLPQFSPSLRKSPWSAQVSGPAVRTQKQ
jgi:CheY-like chemotaxis protein